MSAEDSNDPGTAGFADGERYQSSRPDYPADAVLFMVEALGIEPDCHVIDLGAGTGIFTEQLLSFGPRVTAVEPASGMREVFTRRLPGVTVLDGSDANIPVESGSVDCVVAAQSFHWFDAPVALEEIHRVLVEGGRLGLVWNERDESVPWVAELSRAMRWDVLQPYEVGRDFTEVVAAGPFLNVERRTFTHRQVLDHERLRQQVLSTSYIAVMDDTEQFALMDRVASVLTSLPDPVTMPYVTTVYRATAMLR